MPPGVLFSNDCRRALPDADDSRISVFPRPADYPIRATGTDIIETKEVGLGLFKNQFLGGKVKKYFWFIFPILWQIMVKNPPKYLFIALLSKKIQILFVFLPIAHIEKIHKKRILANTPMIRQDYTEYEDCAKMWVLF